MRQFFFWLIFLFLNFQNGNAQILTGSNDTQAVQDSLVALGKRDPANDSLKIHHPGINDYKFWFEKKPNPIVIDTALTIKSFYQQNFTQKDVFGKMYFPNFGQTFNPLEYNKNNFRILLLPTGKSFNYLYPDDIRYFDVKTPVTEFVYENGMREGQYLSTLFSQNLGPRLNYSVRYRGLRSAGRYKNSLASNNAFIGTVNYHSKSDKFKLWTHYASQNIDNQENGGIKNLNEFVYDDSLRTTNRQNISVNLNTAHTEFDSRRFHLGSSFGLFGVSKTDSTGLKSGLILKNVFDYEKQKYFYKEKQAEDYYESPVFSDLGRNNLKSFETLSNMTTAGFNWGDKLLVEAGFKYEHIKLYGEQSLNEGLTNLPRQISDQLLGTVASLNFDWNERVKLSAEAEFKSGDIFKNQYHLNAEFDIQPLGGYHLIAGGLIESAFPSLNFYYNQSFYKDFNYYNFSFQNLNTQKLFGKIELDKLNTQIIANLYNIENFVFVDTDFRPKQLNEGISIFQIKGDFLISYRKFNLNTTLEYQKVTHNATYLPLPELIARASVFWQNKVFNNKAELQIGLNVNYFTEFESREFFPVINEFMIQRDNPEFGIQKIGGFPMLDFFLNMKVQRMRIFLRADHFNALWGKNNYYSAPFTPFRDFKFQIGVKWYLFT